MSHTLADLFEHYAQEYLSDKAPYTRYFNQLFFRRLLKELGPLPLTDVTPEVLRAWKMTTSQRCKPGSVRQYMKMLSAALRVAVEEYGWLKEHPLRVVRFPKPSRGRVRFLSDDERTALLDACQASSQPLLYPIVLTALSTGGRKNEVRTLAWSQVDLEHGLVSFLETKTDEPRRVPLVGEALVVLQRLFQGRQSACPWVFPNPRGNRPLYFENAWQAAREESGIQHFRFHDLRHTFASYMAMSGASLRDIAELLGHKNIQQTMIYIHLLPSHTAGVVARMAQQFLVKLVLVCVLV